MTFVIWTFLAIILNTALCYPESVVKERFGDEEFLSPYDRLSFTPDREVYEFNENSREFECSFEWYDTPNENGIEIENLKQNPVMKIRNLLTNTEIASSQVSIGRKTHVNFKLHRIQTSTSFSCELHDRGRLIARKLVQVFVYTFSEIQCLTDRDCWGYGRNVVCDSEDSRRCMCALKTARTAASPICIRVIPASRCDHMSCDETDSTCECTQDPAIVLESLNYKHQEVSSIDNFDLNDQILLYNNTKKIDTLYLMSARDECRRCLRLSSDNLQNLQIGLFLIGVVLAFTAVTLMAVVIRKMWHHYRIPDELLEASRDIERDTIERDAEQMAQRDKPPSYVEVMEYDLNFNGLPPPDYEDLSTVVREHSDRIRQRNNLQRQRRLHNIYSCITTPSMQPVVRPISTISTGDHQRMFTADAPHCDRHHESREDG